VAAVCDLVSALGDPSHSWTRSWFKGASYALLVATLSVSFAIGSGLVDRARQTDAGSQLRARVTPHMVLMILLAAVCVVDLLLRTNKYGSAHQTPTAVLAQTLVAVALVIAGAELGGRLVYRRGVAVKRETRQPEHGEAHRTPASATSQPVTRAG
jgi:uncharacterized membrane protein